MNPNPEEASVLDIDDTVCGAALLAIGILRNFGLSS
jgi:hypothetical protein